MAVAYTLIVSGEVDMTVGGDAVTSLALFEHLHGHCGANAVHSFIVHAEYCSHCIQGEYDGLYGA